ncbi:hypothetical protein [Marivita lacus]|nr:hypothetical protein [Marivita lacus]
MYSGLQTRRTAHQLYLKMSYLELEKVRRRKEMEALQGRLHALEERGIELEQEILATQIEINNHPEIVSPNTAQDIQSSKLKGRQSSASEAAHRPGLNIKY